MPTYNGEDFIFRIEHGDAPIKRVYKGDELVYSLYDIAYNVGSPHEDTDNAVIIDDNYPVRDVWGNSSQLPKVEHAYDFITHSWGWEKQSEEYSETIVEDYDEWYTKHDFSSDALKTTEKSNWKNYNLYIDLTKKCIANKTNKGFITETYTSHSSKEDAESRARDEAILNNAYEITGYNTRQGDDE